MFGRCIPLVLLALLAVPFKAVFGGNEELIDTLERMLTLELNPIKQGDVIEKNFVSATLGSNMVLQRDKAFALWGYSEHPGATVSVTVKNDNSGTTIASGSTTASGDGFWRVELPAQSASLDSNTVAITSNQGEAETLQDVLFGDVYLCGGQSNMMYSLSTNKEGYKEAKEGENYPHIRLFTVGHRTSSEIPLPDLQSAWQPWAKAGVASLHKSRPNQTFSTVCWIFGRDIADGLNNQVPIGLISSNVGETELKYWQVGGLFYNSMIHPFMVGPMGLSGFLWYQGESNAHSMQVATHYAHHFPKLIEEWRSGFGIPNAYFAFVQLSGFCHHAEMAMLRASQMQAMNRVGGKIAYATAADRGDVCNPHPPDKRDVGHRLAKSALALQYGMTEIQWKSPTYAGTKASTDSGNSVSIVIGFQDVSSQGLYLIDTPYNIDPNRPTIEEHAGSCEEEGQDQCWGARVKVNQGIGWVNATISIESSTEVKFEADLPAGTNSGNAKIISTSYGWANVPLMTIYDKGTDLPVLPWFRHVTGQSS